ncbi:efflux RND transporter periplasmic adaptor subunit [Rhizobium ruizarguesonis]|uniref:efflux RND transporter periplasmic adaptor subunit n=1 Tax=Rhizobium ruizarguesonis TaxID=2081791 RepID=UPI00102F72E5|nr:efflux RND transporter periplasmic adaptor subunit [Rhizobium ruizarguesonis]TAY86020.1 efflux RND transporter periplasmic adaptor subunit [Rhizobium ruizarguesonis]
MRTILVATAIACAVGLGSCSDERGPTEPTARQVGVVVAKPEPLVQGGAVTGEVLARVQTDLSFRVSGKIIERLVEVGHVKAGQLLARIDPEEQKAELDVAAANLQSAEAQQTQAQLAYDRQQSLFRTQVTTRAALDQAQEALLTAQASTKSAQALLETAQDTLSYTELKADADGMITARNAEVGQVAQAAQVVFTLAHDGDRDAVFEVVESAFLRPIDGDGTVALLSNPSQKIAAKVREISPTIDSSTGTIKVKVAISSDAPIPLGAPVVGRFDYVSQDVIQLPWSAMTSKDGKPAVWIVDPASSAVSARAVDVSGYETGRFIVKSGVSEGEVVVADGTKFLRPGEIVSYVKEASK